MPGEILGVDHADGHARLIHHHEVVDAMLLEEAEDFADEFVAMDVFGILRHVKADGLVADPGATRLEGTGKVALGEDAC